MNTETTKNRCFISFAVAFCGLVGLLSACSSSTFTGQSNANQLNKNSTSNSGNSSGPNQQSNGSGNQSPNSNFSSPGNVVPPVTVLGSYLTAVLNDDQGNPIAAADVTIRKSNYSTKTDSNGEFSIPISKIPADETFKIEIRSNNHGKELETDLPADIRAQINQALESSNPPAQIPRQLGLVVAHSALTNSSTNSNVERASSNSLPLSTPQMRVGNLTNILASSEGKFARFSWNVQIGKPTTAEIRLAYGKSEAGLLAWDGSSDNVLFGHGGYIRGIGGCSDDTGFNMGGEVFKAGGVEKCGINLDLPPFAPGADFYFRLVAKSESEWQVSRVFKVRSTTPVASGWSLYTPDRALCRDSYSGPALNPNSFRTAQQQQPPECNAQNLFKVWCNSEPDDSASKCKDCEENLLICK